MNDRAYDAVAMVTITIQALEAIQKLTHVGGDRTADALKAIDAIVTSLGHGFEGKTTPDLVLADVLSAYGQFHKELTANDAAADAAAAAKFPKT